MYQLIGNLIIEPGWEDLVFESGLSESGNLNGVVSGSLYNRCWTSHPGKINSRNFKKKKKNA